MQNDSSRVLQKSYMLARPSQQKVLSEAREEIINALIINQEESSARIAEILAHGMFQTPLGEVLTFRFCLKVIRSERRKSDMGVQISLPGFEHIPPRIPTREGKRIPLLDANYRRLRDYYRSIATARASRLRNDPKLKELKNLIERVRAYAEREEGITVRQVLLLEER